MSNYIDIPIHTTLNEIIDKNYTLSATQYKRFCIKNSNHKALSDFLDGILTRKDLGYEVGSECYVSDSDKFFIKTKALQSDSYLLDINKESFQSIIPSNFVNMNLKKGDILISKDSNVGETVILDKDYPNAMLCSGIYRLPISNHKYYLLAIIKSELFRQQIDFLIPRGSTIRHGKTKFLDCRIPLPNKNSKESIMYVEVLMQAIINKEIIIREKHKKILDLIYNELKDNQNAIPFSYSLPSINDIIEMDRMDSCLYSRKFKEKEYLIKNYIHGTSNIYELGFKISRGQNLQISNIGKSVHTREKREGYYKLILPKYISVYGTVKEEEYIGNPNELKTLEVGDVIFGAEGNEKGRSLVVLEPLEKTITNIHGITLKQDQHDMQKGIFVKLFLDYLRKEGLIDSYAVGGNGGSLAIKYWNILRFPNFPDKIENYIVRLYHNNEAIYNAENCTISNFLKYDNEFNKKAGIYEIHKSLVSLQKKT